MRYTCSCLALAASFVASAELRGGENGCTFQWSDKFGPVPTGMGMNDRVSALAAYDHDGPGPNPPSLYAGGTFVFAGSTLTTQVARWTGRSWASLAGGVGNAVYTLAVFDEDAEGPALPMLFVGGEFIHAGTRLVDHIAKWDGAQWLPLSSEPQLGAIVAMAVHDDDGPGPHAPALYVTGAVSRVKRWTGTAWESVGGQFNGTVNALASVDTDGPGPNPPQLYAGGDYTQVTGGPSAVRVARWNGSQWLAVGSGFSATVLTLAGFDDGTGEALYAGGLFEVAGLNPVHYAARWNGSQWFPMGGGMNGPVRTLAVVDCDGSGLQPAALYAGGDFSQAGRSFAQKLARWDGAQWSAIGADMNAPVHALARLDTGAAASLFAGGDFVTAGGHLSLRIAEWSPPPGNSNGDGDVDGIDLANLLAAWGLCPAPPAACPADLDGNGLVNGLDLAMLLAQWG